MQHRFAVALLLQLPKPSVPNTNPQCALSVPTLALKSPQVMSFSVLGTAAIVELRCDMPLF